MPKTVRQTVTKIAPAARLRVLFTCVGRRVELVNAFRRAADKLAVRLQVHAADASRLAPALHRVDRAHILPSITAEDYVDALVTLVKRAGIDLLIPLIDPELPIIAAAAPRLTAAGCRPLISSPHVIEICMDKMSTYRALTDAGIDTPATWTWREATQRRRHRFPYFLKPRTGSAAMGNYIVRSREELDAFAKCVPDPIVQEFVPGIEHTLDVYTGFDGRPRCVVPRRRLEVRSGEVSKALIVKDPAIMAAGRRVAEVLCECRGVITVQCIRTPNGRIRVIEINPRFGGGVPLAIHAGADFPQWILAELLGRRPRINPMGFRDDIAMLRFDESVFVPQGSKKLNSR